MPWSQTYDPLGSLLSTLLAALPVVVLLGGLALLPVASASGSARRAGHRAGDGDRALRDARADGIGQRRVRRGLWPAAHRLDRRQRHLSLPADERARPVRRAATQHHARHRGPPSAVAGRGVLFRRVLRGRVWIRHAGCRDRRDSDRAGLFAAGGVGAVADRQHRAGGLWRAGHAGDRASERHRPRPVGVERHGRAPAAAVLGHRAFWLVCAFAGWRGMLEVWPAILVAGLGFAIPQFVVSNYHGPWLVDVSPRSSRWRWSRCSCACGTRRACGRRPGPWSDPSGTDPVPQGSDATWFRGLRSGARGRRGSSSASSSSPGACRA